MYNTTVGSQCFALQHIFSDITCFMIVIYCGYGLFTGVTFCTCSLSSKSISFCAKKKRRKQNFAQGWFHMYVNVSAIQFKILEYEIMIGLRQHIVINPQNVLTYLGRWYDVHYYTWSNWEVTTNLDYIILAYVIILRISFVTVWSKTRSWGT